MRLLRAMARIFAPAPLPPRRPAREITLAVRRRERINHR